jgi:hypothetical protein
MALAATERPTMIDRMSAYRDAWRADVEARRALDFAAHLWQLAGSERHGDRWNDMLRCEARTQQTAAAKLEAKRAARLP